MLDLKSIDEIKTELLSGKKSQVNFPKKSLFDFPENYRELVTIIKTIEISAECILYDSVKSVNETNEFSNPDYWNENTNFSDIKSYWFFGANGQGDLWVLHKSDRVFFYDHNKGELSRDHLIDLGIDFEQWLQYAFLNKQFAEIDYEGKLTTELRLIYKTKLSELNLKLAQNYPFEI